MSGRFTVTNLVAFVFLVPFAVAVAQTQPTAVQSASATPQFHGTYEELKPQQKQLIDEWYADYNKLTGDHADPKEYNQVSLSTLTTSYVGSWMTITMALRNMCLRVAMRA
jgi:hypothetical protein